MCTCVRVVLSREARQVYIAVSKTIGTVTAYFGAENRVLDSASQEFTLLEGETREGKNS